jgi:hypothetical protein
MYLAVANSSPSSCRAQWATQIVVASTITLGSLDACTAAAGTPAATDAAAACFGDAGGGGEAGAGAEGPGSGSPGAWVQTGGVGDADGGAGHAFDTAARALGFGDTSAHHDERGANTPWYLTLGDLRRGNERRKPGHEVHRRHDAVGASFVRDLQA